MTEYMLIYKGGDPTWLKRSAAEKAEGMKRWGAWFEALGKRGQLVSGGAPLAFDGKRMTKDGVVTDIAASEIKELVSGYSIIRAESYEEAVAITRECPIFAGPSTVEIRAIVPM